MNLSVAIKKLHHVPALHSVSLKESLHEAGLTECLQQHCIYVATIPTFRENTTKANILISRQHSFAVLMVVIAVDDKAINKTPLLKFYCIKLIRDEFIADTLFLLFFTTVHL